MSEQAILLPLLPLPRETAGPATVTQPCPRCGGEMRAGHVYLGPQGYSRRRTCQGCGEWSVIL
jgi:hypothetical protein